MIIDFKGSTIEYYITSEDLQIEYGCYKTFKEAMKAKLKLNATGTKTKYFKVYV